MNVTVLHDEHGEILGISEIVDLKAAKSNFTRVGIIPGTGHRTTDIELSGGLETKPLELYKDYLLRNL